MVEGDLCHQCTRWRAEAALAVLLAVTMSIAGFAALRSVYTIPVHKDAAEVASTAAVARTDRYAGPVDESRRLARALVARDNLPGLSVAVAVDGEIVWADDFGWADVAHDLPGFRPRDCRRSECAGCKGYGPLGLQVADAFARGPRLSSVY